MNPKDEINFRIQGVNEEIWLKYFGPARWLVYPGLFMFFLGIACGWYLRRYFGL